MDRKARRAFEAWVAKNGLDPRSDEANYGFLKHELTGSHAYALRNLKRQSDPYAAMKKFEVDYEGAGIKHYPSRWKWTQRAMSMPEATAPDLANAAPTPAAPTASALADSLPRPRANAGGGTGVSMGGGGGGGSPVTINIQGHNRDPEALANQVQKRIDEQMKWRTHDVEFSL